MPDAYIVTVSITYRAKGSSGSGTTIQKTSACHPPPFSIGLDRSEDSFYLYYNGGKQSLENSWTNYDLLASSIVSQEYCGTEDFFDCINGACVKKEVYSTPGIYQGIEECEVACGSGCSGKCLSNSEWSKINSLASQLKSKNCN